MQALILAKGRSGRARGRIVAVKDHGPGGEPPPWGRMESKEVWLAEGRADADWPGIYALYSNPGLTVAEYKTALEARGRTIDQVGHLDERALDAQVVADGERKGIRHGTDAATFLAALRVA